METYIFTVLRGKVELFLFCRYHYYIIITYYNTLSKI